MNKKIKETNYLYRCRLCNKVYVSAQSGVDRSYENLINSIHKVCVDGQPPLPLMSVHRCGPLKAGISDFIGCKIQ